MTTEAATRAELLKRLRACGSRLVNDVADAQIDQLRRVVEACERQAKIYADAGLVDEAAK